MRGVRTGAQTGRETAVGAFSPQEQRPKNAKKTRSHSIRKQMVTMPPSGCRERMPETRMPKKKNTKGREMVDDIR